MFEEDFAANAGPVLKKSDNEQANLKAYKGLRENIGEDAFMDLVANKRIFVEGKYGRWEIRMNGKFLLHQEVTIGPKKRPLVWDLCVSTKESLPEADEILALWLSVKHDEEKLIETTNFRSVKTRDEFQGQPVPPRPLSRHYEDEEPTECYSTRA